MKVFILCTILGKKVWKYVSKEEEAEMISRVARERITNKFGPRIVIADTLQHAKDLTI